MNFGRNSTRSDIFLLLLLKEEMSGKILIMVRLLVSKTSSVSMLENSDEGPGRKYFFLIAK